jgi:predicted nucleic acid-binding protein
MRLVCDASPLIVLAKADLLRILPGLAERVETPRAVAEEILAGPADDPMRNLLLQLDWLRVVDLPTPITPLAVWSLGSGESEVLEWARLQGDCTAVLDDRAARRAAEALGVPVTGTLGLVARATRIGLIASFREAAQTLRVAGLHLDPKLVERIAGELEKPDPMP